MDPFLHLRTGCHSNISILCHFLMYIHLHTNTCYTLGTGVIFCVISFKHLNNCRQKGMSLYNVQRGKLRPRAVPSLRQGSHSEEVAEAGVQPRPPGSGP